MEAEKGYAGLVKGKAMVYEDDDDPTMGDPEEYDEPYCLCGSVHSIEELETNKCDCCGKEIE
jgi:DUF2075 family protein